MGRVVVTKSNATKENRVGPACPWIIVMLIGRRPAFTWDFGYFDRELRVVWVRQTARVHNQERVGPPQPKWIPQACDPTDVDCQVRPLVNSPLHSSTPNHSLGFNCADKKIIKIKSKIN